MKDIKAKTKALNRENIWFPNAISSEACKHVYQKIPQAREILSRHGKLKGLTNSCPYLQLEGKSHGGTYIISLNQKLFDRTNK